MSNVFNPEMVTSNGTGIELIFLFLYFCSYCPFPGFFYCASLPFGYGLSSLFMLVFPLGEGFLPFIGIGLIYLLGGAKDFFIWLFFSLLKRLTTGTVIERFGL